MSTQKSSGSTLTHISLALLFSVAALLFALLFAASNPIVSLNMRIAHKSTPAQELKLKQQNAAETLAFVRGTKRDLKIRTTKAGANKAPIHNYEELYAAGYTADEASHLVDVRTILSPLLLTGTFVTILCLYLAFRMKKTGRPAVLWRVLAYSLPILGLVFLAALAAALFDFSSFFIRFHEIFFPQGNWEFSSESLLIRSFPFEFWLMEAFAIIGGLVFAVLVYIISAVMLFKAERA